MQKKWNPDDPVISTVSEVPASRALRERAAEIAAHARERRRLRDRLGGRILGQRGRALQHRARVALHLAPRCGSSALEAHGGGPIRGQRALHTTTPMLEVQAGIAKVS